MTQDTDTIDTATTLAKISAAQQAIHEAAANLLQDHAEGLALLAMMDRMEVHHLSGQLSDIEEGAPIYLAAGKTFELEPGETFEKFLLEPGANVIRNGAAETAQRAMVKAAVELAGHRESYVHAIEMWADVRSSFARQLAERVQEQVIGPGNPVPPSLDTIAARMRDLREEITPKKVHDRAWRNHLMASTATASPGA